MFNVAFAYFLTEASLATESSFNYSLVLTVVFLVGFVASAVIGSIAWYNSKRPVGWEDKQRPDFVPDVDK
ncbi:MULTISPECIES: photosystem II assembly protein Psb35 [unclassified Tolypothrix]|uniref:photosystem II assembly protein Psb35 n=1 Tax=unclassified Tolypothrix TaxID=2649714 RepID=UPI0005EAA68D|nr:MULTISPECIES: hypothetical protein [unclassified Tolypothrix]BAY34718.1 hypothetical protein NIES2107_66240 [Nostoc carneum NIES-2107]BAY91981.1 hypothetical protein NIES3275_40120 [Microchaete diplosiphon NIES-3275]EKF04833.1 hypothetical protein FDUTEX481_00993 [Tolypothrix sp. PCC 7601]MBE9083783.1 hypothetical protein [Tolypothrix sp. LEGE 11397]UYD25975.1 hypothetical protein HGR01_32455 [Tolypothrix sp. PCC 7712]